MKRAKKYAKSLKTCCGRLLRNLDRKFKSQDLMTDKVKKVFEICFRIFNQRKSDKNKIYSVHAPEMKCISKGKAHKKYEFGNKVSVATTVKKNFVVGALSFNSNLFDGKTPKVSLEQASKIMGKSPEFAYVDRGYRGYTKDCGETTVFLQGQRRGIDEPTKKLLKRRRRIEPVIGHLKLGHRLERNFLLGEDGDKINLLLSTAAFNLRKLLSVFVLFIGWIRYSKFCWQRKISPAH